ncbi:hypothetical protein AB6848_11335 [Serratia proteamaculans]|uniref:hypothetical protein n=1 Tax=Serratia proteamaculans TaxID=28151 RepID=UPI0039BE137F
MTIYTTKPDSSLPRPLCNIQPSFGDALTASVSSGWHDSALVSYFRNSKLDGISAKSGSDFVEKNIANEALANYGISYVSVPEHGIKKDVFNAIIDDRITQIHNEQILCGVSNGTPLSYLSSTAGFISSPVTLIVIIIIAFLFAMKKRNSKND